MISVVGSLASARNPLLVADVTMKVTSLVGCRSSEKDSSPISMKSDPPSLTLLPRLLTAVGAVISPVSETNVVATMLSLAPSLATKVIARVVVSGVVETFS